MYDVIVIGAGPAGITAGIYAKRSGVNVLVLYYGESNLEKTNKIDNYYGFENGISGKDLYEAGINQAKNLGIIIKNEEVVNIKNDSDGFCVETINGSYNGRSVIIATGNKKISPDIKGILEFEGKGVSYCAVCDGFFFKDKNVVVIGNGDYALSEAEELSRVAGSVTILTDGQDESKIENSKFRIITEKITEIYGEESVSSIAFENGLELSIDGVFVALGEAGSGDFAKKLGIMLSDDSIDVDENMQTNIPGVYSCGNSVGGFLQICKSTHEGAIAGLAAAKYAKEL